MKPKNYLLFMLSLLVMNSCKKDNVGPEMPKGRLSIELGLFMHVDSGEPQMKTAGNTEDFEVSIRNSFGSEVYHFDKAYEMPEEIELEPGDYYVAANSGNNLPAAFDNPYYYGQSDVFTIHPNEQKTITVNCELANSLVTIVYSDKVQSYFADYQTTVSSSAGSLVYVKDEIRTGYFQPLSLNISVLLSYKKPDGSDATKTLTGSIPEPKPKTKYEIHIDAAPDLGMGAFSITLDESVESTEIVNIGEENVAGPINYGDLLITEIMYDPVALTDATGEWFEIYNNSQHPVDLQNVVIKRDATERHVITGAISLLPGNYCVLARNVNAVSCDVYVYGTGITLSNAGAVLGLYNYGTDGTDGSLIFSVDYGSSGFVKATGTSLSLNPLYFNATDAQKGTSWCTASSVYNTGDYGTPGMANDACNL